MALYIKQRWINIIQDKVVIQLLSETSEKSPELCLATLKCYFKLYFCYLKLTVLSNGI